MRRKLLILSTAALALVLSLMYLPGHLTSSSIAIGDTVIIAEIADTPEERVQGLSGRSGLKAGEGMLFIFDEPAMAGIWMKDMNFAIDIVWIDSSGLVIEVLKGVDPSTYPETFTPPAPVKYVLEVASGFSDTVGINVGEKLSIGQ